MKPRSSGGNQSGGAIYRLGRPIRLAPSPKTLECPASRSHAHLERPLFRIGESTVIWPTWALNRHFGPRTDRQLWICRLLKRTTEPDWSSRKCLV